MNELEYRRALETCTQEINEWALPAKKFKIGKTGQNVDDRKAQEDYKTAFDHIVEVFQDTDCTAIDRLEKELIERFKSYDQCENEQDGGGPSGESDKIYIVYS